MRRVLAVAVDADAVLVVAEDGGGAPAPAVGRLAVPNSAGA